MSDRFFTFMLVPERSDKIRKFSIPATYLKISIILGTALIILGVFVLFDYIHLLSQVAENKKLRVENHLLKLDVQEAKNKLDTLDQSVSRLKSFAQKLRVISNLDSAGSSRLLEAPSGTQPGYIPSNEEESGSIEDGSSSNGSPSSNSGAAMENAPSDPAFKMSPGDLHAQLEYQRSLTLGKETEVYADDILGQLRLVMSQSERLQQLATLEEQNFASLQEHIQDSVDRIRATPSVLPARGWISSEFGYRINPFSGRRSFHAGIDIANFTGTPVYAPADGTVSFVGIRGGYGNVVQIDHGFSITTRYGHNSRILVTKGQKVRRGDKIAEIGSTGRSTAPHLHYEVALNGKPVNPRAFILEDTF